MDKQRIKTPRTITNGFCGSGCIVQGTLPAPLLYGRSGHGHVVETIPVHEIKDHAAGVSTWACCKPHSLYSFKELKPALI